MPTALFERSIEIASSCEADGEIPTSGYRKPTTSRTCLSARVKGYLSPETPSEVYAAQPVKLVRRACSKASSSGEVAGLDSLSACTACTMSPLNLSKTWSRLSPEDHVAFACAMALTKWARLESQCGRVSSSKSQSKGGIVMRARSVSLTMVVPPWQACWRTRILSKQYTRSTPGSRYQAPGTARSGS